ELCQHLPGTAQGAYGGKRDKEEPAWKISHGEAFEEKRLAREGKRAEKPAFCPPDDRGEAARSQQAQRDWALGRRSGLQQLLQALCGDIGRPEIPLPAHRNFLQPEGPGGVRCYLPSSEGAAGK